MNVTGAIASVQVGRIAPLGAKAIPSGFIKSAVVGSVHVTQLGLSSDQQADLSVHGGPEKAVYGYAHAHYALWSETFPEHQERLANHGAFGENLTLTQMNENNVCIGDVVEMGDIALQVCQPRQPCFKFALRFDDNRMPRAMVRNGCCGWYYRVLREGFIEAGQAVRLVERPNPEWTVARFFSLITRGQATKDDVQVLATLPGLASQWAEWARENTQSEQS